MIRRSDHSILVVEDTEAARYALVRTLRAAGYATMETASGEEALLLAEYCTAVVLDLNLPDVSGWEVARLLRAIPDRRRMPIVHVSAKHITVEDRQESTASGADAFFVSPVDGPTLVATLDRLLGP